MELSEIPKEFTLYGGTAVALHLGHRQSIDFDFFGTNGFSPLDLASSLNLLAGGTAIQSEPNTLTMIIDRHGPVKISFFGVPRLKRVSDPHLSIDNGLQVNSLLDLADELKHRLVKAVRAVDLDRLPKIEGTPDT
jgi:hypothetical protein